MERCSVGDKPLDKKKHNSAKSHFYLSLFYKVIMSFPVPKTIMISDYSVRSADTYLIWPIRGICESLNNVACRFRTGSGRIRSRRQDQLSIRKTLFRKITLRITLISCLAARFKQIISWTETAFLWGLLLVQEIHSTSYWAFGHVIRTDHWAEFKREMLELNKWLAPSRCQ